jgi:hypothetical protein
MDQLEVEFCADTGGTFRMTWGQQDFWRRKVRLYGDASWHFNIPVVLDLPGDTGPADHATVGAVLRRLVERNQSLRAHFLESLDGPLQQIARSGTFTLRLHQSTLETSRVHADELAAELAAAHFNHETEWGIRIALVCAGQLPRHVVFVISHQVADGGGVQVLIDDFFDLLRAQADGSKPKGRWQPIDQVLREESKRGIRRNQAALRYWRKQLKRIPPSMFAFPAAPTEQPRFRRLRLDSRALTVAAARLAADCQVSVPSTLLAGTALALATLSGQTTCVLRLVLSNRYDDDARGTVVTASQDGLLVVDYLADTVAEAVRATHRAARTAAFYGFYDPVAVDGLINAVAVERGVHFDLNALYNDLSAFLDGADGTGLARASGARVPEADARKLLRESVVVPESTWDGQSCKMYLAAEPGTDICSLHLLGDTAYLPPPTMQALLLGIETIVFEAAYRDIAIADVPALTGLMPAVHDDAGC